MAKLKDLIKAKDELSTRLLRARARGRVVAMTLARTIKDARKNAGRNVHAVGVGRKIVNGKPTRTLCVRLYVVEKLAESVVPRAARLPKRIAGLPTDVIESPPAFAHQPPCSTNRALRQRPMVGGISAAHEKVNKATLGCFCHSTLAGERGRLYMLSNNHAFAHLNRGVPGDPILQPSPGDGGSLAGGDRVGVLARFEPIRLGGKDENLVDAAIAEVLVLSDVVVPETVCVVGILAAIGRATNGLSVCKHGQKSAYTEGTVDDIAMNTLVEYGADGKALFVNQIRIVPAPGFPAWVQGGDSGSVVVAMSSRRAIGLHFAGPEDGSYGVANHMRDVRRLLNITIP